MSYVPKEIIDSMNRGRHFDNVIETYEKDGMLYKKMACGCEFGNKIKSFGFSNHFCSEHAPGSNFSWNTDKEEGEPSYPASKIDWEDRQKLEQENHQPKKTDEVDGS